MRVGSINDPPFRANFGVPRFSIPAENARGGENPIIGVTMAQNFGPDNP